MTSPIFLHKSNVFLLKIKCSITEMIKQRDKHLSTADQYTLTIVASLKTSAVTNQNCKVVFQQPSPREGASGQKRRKRERLYGKRRCSNRILAWGGVGWKPFPNGMCEFHYYFQLNVRIFQDGFKTFRTVPKLSGYFQKTSKSSRLFQNCSDIPR